MWVAWSISAELSCWGGGRLRHLPPLAGSWEPRPVLMAGLPLSCLSWRLPFSYHWLSVGIHRPPERAVPSSPYTPREAKVFPAAARRSFARASLVPRGGPVVESHRGHSAHPHTGISGAPAQPLPSHGALALVLYKCLSRNQPCLVPRVLPEML